MSFLNEKRSASCHKTGFETCKKVKTSQSGHLLHWKLWLMQNYELVLNSCTELSSILNYSKGIDDKENLPDKPLFGQRLGKLIKEIWKGNVEMVRNGARGKQTVKFVHLARKTSVPFHQSWSFYDVKVPYGWSVLPSNPSNNDENTSYVRLENWHVNNHRAITEVCVQRQNERLKFTLVANGCKVDLNDFGNATEKHQMEHVLKLIDESTLCQGYRLEPKERILAMLPHHLEHVCWMSDQDRNGDLFGRMFHHFGSQQWKG